MRRKLTLWVLVLACVLPLGETLHGQGIVDNTPDHPLFDLLAMVPATPNTTGSVVYYVDRDSVFLQLPESQHPRTYNTWDGFFTPLLRIQSEPIFQYLNLYGDLPRIAGFDFFDITHTLHWGIPPGQATIFRGNLDPDAIIAAHTDRDPDFSHLATYEAAQINGAGAWCSVDGCDGTLMSIENRDPSNILDPSGLGRNPPFFVEAGSLTTAFTEAVMADIAAAINEQADSIALNTAYQAMAEAFVAPVDDETVLVQAQFLPAELVNVRLDLDDPGTLVDTVAFSMEQAVDTVNRLRESSVLAAFDMLPLYELAGIADYHHPDYQAVTIATVHATENAAEIAAAELANRLSVFTLPFILREDGETLLDRFPEAEIQEPVVFAGSDDTYVALVSVRYPNVDLLSDDGPRAQAGLMMRLFYNAWQQRELYLFWQISGQ